MLNKDKERLKITSASTKKVVLWNIKTNKTLHFKSLTMGAEYFRNLGFKPTGNTLRSYIEAEKNTTVLL